MILVKSYDFRSNHIWSYDKLEVNILFWFSLQWFAKNLSLVFPPSVQFNLHSKMTFNYSLSTVCWFEMRFHNLGIVFSSQSDSLPMRKMSFSNVDKTFPSLIHLLCLLSLNVFTKKSLKSSQSVFNILIFFKKMTNFNIKRLVLAKKDRDKGIQE